jgi:hypothetical protein
VCKTTWWRRGQCDQAAAAHGSPLPTHREPALATAHAISIWPPVALAPSAASKISSSRPSAEPDSPLAVASGAKAGRRTSRVLHPALLQIWPAPHSMCSPPWPSGRALDRPALGCHCMACCPGKKGPDTGSMQACSVSLCVDTREYSSISCLCVHAVTGRSGLQGSSSSCMLMDGLRDVEGLSRAGQRPRRDAPARPTSPAPCHLIRVGQKPPEKVSRNVARARG